MIGKPAAAPVRKSIRSFILLSFQALVQILIFALGFHIHMQRIKSIGSNMETNRNILLIMVLKSDIQYFLIHHQKFNNNTLSKPPNNNTLSHAFSIVLIFVLILSSDA